MEFNGTITKLGQFDYSNISSLLKTFKSSNLVITKVFYRSKSQFHKSKQNIYETEYKDKANYDLMLRQYKLNLIDQILNQRKNAIQLIIKTIKAYINNLKIKRNIIIQKILKQREKSALLIQSIFRRHFVQRDLENILSPLNRQIFFYIPPNETNAQFPYTKIELKYKNQKILPFSYSKVLNKYYVLLKRTGKKEYRFNFIINNDIIIDSRYPLYINRKNGKFYNTITLKMMYRKTMDGMSLYSYKTQNKFWENIFRINNYHQRRISLENLSDAQSDLSAELNSIINDSDNSQQKANTVNTQKSRKSILKKTNEKDVVNNNKKEKKVTFSSKCEYYLL